MSTKSTSPELHCQSTGHQHIQHTVIFVQQKKGLMLLVNNQLC